MYNSSVVPVVDAGMENSPVAPVVPVAGTAAVVEVTAAGFTLTPAGAAMEKALAPGPVGAAVGWVVPGAAKENP